MLSSVVARTWLAHVSAWLSYVALRHRILLLGHVVSGCYTDAETCIVVVVFGHYTTLHAKEGKAKGINLLSWK